MKILHTVEFYHPSTGGMQAVCKQLSEKLAKLGHEVTVATSYLPERSFSELNGIVIKDFKIRGRESSGYQADPEEIKRYQKFLLDNEFDVMTNFGAQQWATDIALPLLPKIKAKKVFVPTGFYGLNMNEFKDYFLKMETWIKSYDWQIFLSNNYRDINFSRGLGLKNLSVIPNGASTEEFLAPDKEDIRAKLGIPKDHFLIVHIGSHTGLKGHWAARQIFKQANIPHSTLLLIGNSYPGTIGCTFSCKEEAKHWFKTKAFKNRDQQLLVKDLKREETVAALKSAQLFLFPSNLECSPIVLFEAMASCTPFLSTNVGNAEEIIQWSGGGELLPTKICSYTSDNWLKMIIKPIMIYWQELISGNKAPQIYSRADIDSSIKQLENLYHNPAKLQELAESGFKAWQQKFTWEQITLEYEKIYKQITKL